MSGKIRTKIDWFTAVFQDCRVVDVLSHFEGLSSRLSKDFEELWSERFIRSKGYTNEIVVNIGGACVQLRYDEVLNSDLQGSAYNVFTDIFRYIRFDMSGSALDEYRAMGYDVDELLFKEWDLDCGTYHVTRCDFAFDLLDYCPQFLDYCFDWVDKNRTPSGRILTASSKQGIAFETHRGDSECLIIGGRSSDKKLRIYDKGYQLMQGRTNNLYDGQWSEKWIRIELQLRREHAHGVLYSESDRGFMPVFRYIYDNYCFRNSSSWDDLSEGWKQLFDWKLIPTIIQNAKSVVYEPVIVRAERWIKNTALGNLVVYMSHFGEDALIKLIKDTFYELSHSGFNSSFMRYNGILRKCLADSHELPEHLKFIDGNYQIV